MTLVTQDAHDRRCRDERGAAIVEFLVTAPVLGVLIFGLIIQGGLWFQGRELAQGAAMQGALAAAAKGGDGGDASSAATQFLDASPLVNPRVSTSIGATTVEVEVTGDIPVLVPGWTWSTTQRAVVGREVLTTP